MELLKELFRFRRYKASQGRLIRRLTMAGVWVLFATAAWKCTLFDFTWVARGLGQTGDAVGTSAFIIAYSLAMLVAMFGLWFGYRFVNWVTFSDFLIAVEAEMAKVSWPGRGELKSSTIVVLVVFLLLSGMIYMYDLVLVFLFRLIGVM